MSFDPALLEKAADQYLLRFGHTFEDAVTASLRRYQVKPFPRVLRPRGVGEMPSPALPPSFPCRSPGYQKERLLPGFMLPSSGFMFDPGVSQRKQIRRWVKQIRRRNEAFQPQYTAKLRNEFARNQLVLEDL